MLEILRNSLSGHLVNKVSTFIEVDSLEQKYIFQGFPGGAVVKNPPANAGDTGSSPGPGRSLMPWSN